MEDRYSHKNLDDKITLIGELEHFRRHNIRKCVLLKREAQNELDDVKRQEMEEEIFRSEVTTNLLQKARRELMRQTFPDIPDKDWCILKTLACIRQLLYETDDYDDYLFDSIEGLVEDTLGAILGENFTDCKSCIDDRAKDKKDPDEL